MGAAPQPGVCQRCNRRRPGDPGHVGPGLAAMFWDSLKLYVRDGVTVRDDAGDVHPFQVDIALG